MYLSRLTLNYSRRAGVWVDNPYRVHQRLMMACERDPRLLFRVEATPTRTQILVQTINDPRWNAAFADFPVLNGMPEMKPFNPQLMAGGFYRFKLLANPSVKKTKEIEGAETHKTRLGIMQAQEQVNWLQRKLTPAGEVYECQSKSQGLQRSHKNPEITTKEQVHLAVLFEGFIKVTDPEALLRTIQSGIGPAKAYGFGLLSLARL